MYLKMHNHNGGSPVTLLLLGCMISVVLAVCPDPDPRDSLPLWSDPNTWAPGSKPVAGSDVTLTKVILLDETVDLGLVTIESTGGLIWSPTVDLDFSAKYVYVGGRFELGSEDCPLTTQTTITLKGNRGDYPDIKGGEKGIICGAGSTCEVHGRPKRSWTKLAKTVKTIQDNGDVLFHHKVSPNAEYKMTLRGLVAYTFTLDVDNNLSQKDFDVYDLNFQMATKEHLNEATKLVAQINGLSDGDIFMLTTQRYYRLNTNKYIPLEVYEALETQIHGSVTNDLKLRSIGNVKDEADTYAMIFRKGEANSFIEDTHPLGTSSMVQYVTESGPNGIAFQASVEGSSGNMNQHEDFYVTTYDGLYQSATVLDDVTTWRAGDKVVFSSTDYDYKQAEERVIAACPLCAPNQFRITEPLTFEHYGEIWNNVDMRGEVAMLTRNIVIRGETQATCPTVNGNCGNVNVGDVDTFGVHIKILRGYLSARFEGAELYNVGQQTDLGRYPLHFHMCLDKVEEANIPYFRGNSIHDTFARCITVHGSHGIQVIDNVCYKARGHAFFEEDGGEKYTRFDGNIAISTLSASGFLEPTDKASASSFWITNPLTFFENNVAAGGMDIGIWFVFPESPMGPSASANIMELYEAKHTSLLSFSNNVAHSYSMGGFFYKQRLDPVTRKFLPGNHYQPRRDPLVPNSLPVVQVFEYLTTFKNGKFNTWIEGGQIVLRKSSSAHSQNGMTLTNQDIMDFTGSVSECVILGDSANKGVSAVSDYEGSFPIMNAKNTTHKGFLFWRGPITLDSVWFSGFSSNPYFISAAIGQKDGTIYSNDPLNQASNLIFNFDDAAEGNRVLDTVDSADPLLSANSAKGAVFRDIDGTLTGTPMSQVVPSIPFLTGTGNCKGRVNWEMSVCADKYGAIRVTETNFVIVRDDYPGAEMTSIDMNDDFVPVILGGQYSYTIHFLTEFPSMAVRLEGRGVEKGLPVRVGLCLPLDADFKVTSSSPFTLSSSTFIQVESLSELDTDDFYIGRKYFYDSTTGMLYYKFVSFQERDATDPLTSCPKDNCPDIKVELLSGDRSDSDCRTRLYGADRATKLPPSNEPLFDSPLPKNPGSGSPPEGWGAGSSYPFFSANRAPINGGYGAWSAWSECSDCSTGGTRTRYRMCDSPLPQNGGTFCTGEATQTESCTC